MKRILILLFSLFVLTGCSDYRELTDMAIASSIGLDIKDGNYNVIVHVLDAKKTGEKDVSPNIKIYESSGKTLHEALRKIVLESPQKLYVGHFNSFVISESFAKEGISKIFDFILRDSEVEKSFNLIVTKNNINEIMNINNSDSNVPLQDISKSIDLSTNIEGSTSSITFDRFIESVMKIGIDPVLPVILIKDEDDKKTISLDEQIAIFKDDKLVSYLNKDNTFIYNLLNNNLSSSVFSFKCDKSNYGSIEILDYSSNYYYDFDLNKIITEVDIISSLSELNCNMNIENNKIMDEIENKIKNELSKNINNFFNEIKKSESDILGIEQYIYRNNYLFYEKNKNNISELLSNSEIDLNLNITIEQIGSLKKGNEKIDWKI